MNFCLGCGHPESEHHQFSSRCPGFRASDWVQNCLNCGHSEGHHDDGDVCGADLGTEGLLADVCACPGFRVLTPDPLLGTREGWRWCPECAGIQPPTHQHDEFEAMSREELLALVRASQEVKP